MSLILEALKKSEAKRRLGEAPDLATPFAAAAPRRALLPFILAAIVIAAGAGWWLLGKPTTTDKPAPAIATQPQGKVNATATAKPSVDRVKAVEAARVPVATTAVTAA